MEDLVALQDRRVFPFESSHDLLSVSDLPVETFHLVIVHITLQMYVSDMSSSGFLLHCPELFVAGFPVSLQTVCYEDFRSLACDSSSLLEESDCYVLVFGVCDFLSYPVPCLVVHESEEVLHVAFDFDP